MATAKFYWFDVGVANALMRRGEILPGSELFGPALEHLVLLDLKAYLDYRRLDLDLAFWRTHAGHEVDFVIDGAVAIEVKASHRVSDGDLKGLRALAEETTLKTRMVVSMEPRERRTDDGIAIVPVAQFFEELWEGRIVEGVRRW